MVNKVNEAYAISRRRFLQVAAGAGAIIVGGSAFWPDGYAFAAGTSDTGLPSTLGSASAPEQVHLTFGSDASSEVTVSWAVPAIGTTAPYLQYVAGGTAGSPATIPPVTAQISPSAKQYTDGLSGETVYLYHAPLSGLSGATTYTYMITDPNTGVTFTGTFTTGPSGRFPFAFTSFGDLGTPGNNEADGSKVAVDDANGVFATYTWGSPAQTAYSTDYSESAWNAYLAVTQLGNMTSLIPSGNPAPLFHLMNGDLAYADKQTINSANAVTSGASSVYPAPEVWRDFGLNVQRSAANTPWMPCIGNHEAELDNGPGGYNSFTNRFNLPSNGTSFQGFYCFQVGSVLFLALDANDVCYQGAGAYNVGGNQSSFVDKSGNTVHPYTSQYNRRYTGAFGPQQTDGTLPPGNNAQTVWLQNVLASARPQLVPSAPTSTITPVPSINPASIDWIIVQMHQSALSSSNDNGCDAGIRQAWAPLFDQYQVDLVLSGHDHDYERSYPVRGFTAGSGTSIWGAGGTWGSTWTANVYYNGATPGTWTALASTVGTAVNTLTPNVVTTDEVSPIDTSLGTVYLVLGGGGTDKPDNVYGGYNSSGNLVSGLANVTTFTQIRVGLQYPTSGTATIAAGTKPLPDASEPNAWSCIRDSYSTVTTGNSTGTNSYGIAYFNVDPGTTPGGQTTITITYYHTSLQPSGSPQYTQFDQFVVTRARSDGPSASLPEFSAPAALLVGTTALGVGAMYVHQRRRGDDALQTVSRGDGQNLR
jgi:alkaline phosphatase D